MEISFKRNLSDTDRLVRTVISLVILGLIVFGGLAGAGKAIAFLFGAFMLVQAALGY